MQRKFLILLIIILPLMGCVPHNPYLAGHSAADLPSKNSPIFIDPAVEENKAKLGTVID